MLQAKQDRFWAEEGFDATYTTSDKGFQHHAAHSDVNCSQVVLISGRGCGGVVRNVAGSVTSPLYPGRVSNYTECVWEITVPEGSYVKILFTGKFKIKNIMTFLKLKFFAQLST
jgi:hypothetical protein